MRIPRTAAVLASAAAAVLLLAGPASAHVTAHSSDATPGGEDAEISFRVPNEEASPTTKVLIAFPSDTPLAGVMPASKPGWRATTTSVKLAKPITTDDGDITTAVATITWTATSGGIPTGQYEDFDVAVGLLPDAKSLTFKAVQTYGDGDVVSWIESGDDAEHPAPVLSIGAAEAAPSAVPSVSASAAPVAAEKAEKAEKAADDSTATALGGAGLGVAVLAALLALVALARGRSARP